MQTSDQSSEENQPLTEQLSEAANVTGHEQETLSAPSMPSEQLERQKATTKVDKMAEYEAMQRGLIYPPLPTFYEEMAAPSVGAANSREVPAHPLQSINETPTYPSNSSYNPWQTAPPPNQQPLRAGYPNYPQGQHYTGTQAPPFVANPPSAKKPRKWSITILAVLITIMLLSCGLCAWVGVPLFEQVYSQAYNVEVNGLQVVNDYYTALQNKQYAQAYNNLSTQGALHNITAAEFIAQAEKQDTLYGPILRYTPSQPDLSNYDGNPITTFALKVDIARNKQSYTAQLQLTKVNNQWKISQFNHL